MPYRDAGGDRLQLRMQPARSDAEPVLLREEYDAGDGIRTNRWTLTPAGDAVTIDVEVASTRLPAPVRYRLRYRRAAASAAAVAPAAAAP